MAPTADVEVTATFGPLRGPWPPTRPAERPVRRAVVVRGRDRLPHPGDQGPRVRGRRRRRRGDDGTDGRAGGAHPLRRRIFGRRGPGGHSPGGDPGVGPGQPGLPAVVAAGTTVYEIDRPQVLDFKSDVLRGWTPPWPPTDARSASTCATIGRRRCGGWVLTPPSPRCGSPSSCSSGICRPRSRAGCCAASPRRAPSAAGWPPITCPPGIRCSWGRTRLRRRLAAARPRRRSGQPDLSGRIPLCP